MNAITLLDNYESENVVMYDAMKHTSIMGLFVKLQYITYKYALNAVYLYVSGSNQTNIITETIEKIKSIEEELLSRISFTDKQPQYNLFLTLKKNGLKLLTNNKFISIKITGIWIQNMCYGISYKIIQQVANG